MAEMGSGDGVAQSLRAMIREAVTEDASIGRIRQMIADVFQTTKATMVSCPSCGEAFKASLPDVKAQVDALIDLLEQAEGKAETKPQAETTVIIERPPR